MSGTSVDHVVDGQLGQALTPLVSLVCILDRGDGCNTFEETLKEQDHLLILMNVHGTVVVEHVKAHSEQDVEMWWLEHEEVLVLILEYELVDERILLLLVQILAQLLHVLMTAAILEHLQSGIGVFAIITEDEVAQCKVGVGEFVGRQ